MDATFEEVFTELGYDGQWSLLSKLILRAKKATQIIFSNSWVWAPQNFNCYSCKRTKPYLTRSCGNTLYAHLHLDHDHLADYALDISTELGKSGLPTYLITPLLRFAPTLLCADCNHIDSKLKAIYPDVCCYFTLSPEEKRQVYQAPHKARNKLAHQIWRQQKASHESKKEQVTQNILDWMEDIPTTKLLRSAGKVRTAHERNRFYTSNRQLFQHLSYPEFMHLSKHTLTN
ncbi:MAG: hypothetical protein OXT67_08470 [Zetaproteobacteria bacterium]|nr:hypothetical protein [Zetaproteobacteria bacterium]